MGSGIFEIRFATKVLVSKFAKAEKQLSEADDVENRLTVRGETFVDSYHFVTGIDVADFWTFCIFDVIITSD